jgi:hypothetical protein
MENQPTQQTVKDPRICVSLPVYSQMFAPFVQSLWGARDTLPCIGFIDILPGDSLVNRARNNLASRFLKGFPGNNENGPATVLFDWMLFIDTDLVFQPVAIQTLYELGVRSGPGIYAGTYPLKQLKPKVVFNNLPGKAPGPDGTVEVREAGTGFMLIHREVFEKMKEAFAEEMAFIVDKGDKPGPDETGYDYFSVGVRMDKEMKRKRFLSEDWYFCQRWREIGGKVILHTKIQCGHIGNFVYPGNAQDVLDAAEHIKKGMEMLKTQGKPAGGAVAVSVKTVKSPEPQPALVVAATD